MNGIAIQLSASALALGLMGSAVGVHYAKVKKTTALAALDQSGNQIEYVSHEISLPLGAEEMTPISGFQRGPSIEKNREELQLELIGQMIEQMKQLNEEKAEARKEILALREQVAETNRDLSQLQFRVDTHSESFRPMRLSEESTFQKALPAHPVLPPKNW